MPHTRCALLAALLLPAHAAWGDAPASAPAAPAAAAQFTSSAKWERAGYNSDEIVYTIFIDSQDSRILRCRTHMQGFYLNAGKKQSIADQQLSTVFPQQQVQAGIWMDLDEQSGATYEVHCKPA